LVKDRVALYLVSYKNNFLQSVNITGFSAGFPHTICRENTDIYRMQGNYLIIIGFSLQIVQGNPADSAGKSCRYPIIPVSLFLWGKNLQCTTMHYAKTYL
jgi:hypothetical protein